MEEVASLVTIGPGEEVLFSMPVKNPFEFESPKLVHYSLWDLPRKTLAELGKK
jgi:hypothetical protein